jgi:rod shape-determining protein MreB
MIASLFGRDIAVDFGTATTRIATAGRAQPVEAPSVHGTTPALARGVVVNPDAAAEVLRALLRRARRFSPWRPRVVACTPTDVTPDERAAVVQSLRAAGATAITVAPEPLAAAIGAGRDVSSRYAQLVVDIGHGVTDCAVIRSGQVTATRAVRRACGDLYTAVGAAMLARHGQQLLPGEAERLVARVGVAGAARPDALETQARRAGHERDARVIIPARDVAHALEPVLGEMLGTVRDLLGELPADLGAEVIESGILLSGGGALLPGMAARLETLTGITVQRAPDPLRAVISGARVILPTVVENNLWQH